MFKKVQYISLLSLTLTSSLILLSNDQHVSADDTETVESQNEVIGHVAPEKEGFVLDNHSFTSVDEALAYGREVFDQTRHKEFYVEYYDGYYYIYWELVNEEDVEEEPGELPEEPSDPSDTNPSNPATTYTVQAGDSLYSIAKKFNTSVDEIKSLNNMETNLIFPGQLLNLPNHGQSDGNDDVSEPSSDYIDPNWFLDQAIFKDIPSALRYGRDRFDYKKYKQFYVRSEGENYRIYWELLD